METQFNIKFESNVLNRSLDIIFFKNYNIKLIVIITINKNLILNFNVIYHITHFNSVVKQMRMDWLQIVSKELSGLPIQKCLITKYDQTFRIGRDLKIKTNDGI